MSEIESWHSAGVKHPNMHCESEVLVRAWKAGDGLRCSAAAHNQKNPCGVPVAVVKDVRLRVPGKWEAREVTRVVCLKHLSARFCDSPPSTHENSMNQAALETLASRHWGEYQAILAGARDQLMRDRLAILPKDLQDKVVELLEREQAEAGES